MSRSEICVSSIEEIKNQIKSCEEDQLLFVIDSEIQKNYLDLIKNIQNISDKKVLSYVSMCGEEAKSFSEYEKNGELFFRKRSPPKFEAHCYWGRSRD